MDAPDEDDDFTELVNANIDRVDLVDKAANGTRILFAKSAEGEPVGLFDPGFVRDLVAKADAEQQSAPESVTVTGSPTAVAAMMARIHGAPVRKADMSTADINDLPDSAFAYIEPGGEKDEQGKTTPRSKRHFPVHDAAHTRNALSRAPQSPFGDKAMPRIRAAAKHFGIEVAKADGAEDPGSQAWEGQDADSADQIVQAILALRPRLEAFAAREGAEVAAGEMGDLGDVFDLQAAKDCLMQAAKLVGGVAVAERAESGAVAKATTTTPAAPVAATPQESTVTDTSTSAAAPTEQTASAAVVAKGDAAPGILTQEQVAAIYKEAAEKAARKAIKKAAKEAAAQASGATAADEQARTIPGTETVQAPAQAPDEVTKSAATQIATVLAEVMAPVAKQVENLATLVGSQSERVEKALAKPDDRRSPLLNGATGEPGLALRGGKSPVDSAEFQAVRKAISEMPDGPAKEELQRKVGISAIIGRFSD